MSILAISRIFLNEKSMQRAVPLFLSWLLCQLTFASTGNQEEGKIRDVIKQYHEGLINGKPEVTTQVLANGLFMFNGNFSTDIKEWQPHLYVGPDDKEAWPKAFIREASPYKNELEFLQVKVRGNAALAITSESGSNRFRQWQHEQVVYMLVSENGAWKMTGLFIKDISNPE